MVQPIGEFSVELVGDRDDWICGICEQTVDPDLSVPQPDAPTVDHIVPLSRGGTHSPGNVQLAHFLCNSRKRDLLPGELAAV